jgi:nucleoid-associated protein EbfC
MSDSEQIDFGAFAQRAQQLQGEMSSVQSDLMALQATGFGGGGLATATVSGEGRLVSLHIDPSVLDPGDPETLAEMVIAAVDSANEALAERRKERMTAVTDGLEDMMTRLRPGPASGERVVPRFAPRRLPTASPGRASRPDGPAKDATGP